jgi:hypothetical protein
VVLTVSPERGIPFAGGMIDVESEEGRGTTFCRSNTRPGGIWIGAQTRSMRQPVPQGVIVKERRAGRSACHGLAAETDGYTAVLQQLLDIAEPARQR